jgi:hypothetical protein
MLDNNLHDLEERLGNYLVWRIGKAEDEEILVVRMGFASTAPDFGQLPKLRSVSDEEIEQFKTNEQIRVEWVK